MAVLMETLANLESFVRSAETGSFSAAADAFLLVVGHQVLVTTPWPIFTSHRAFLARLRRRRTNRHAGSAAMPCANCAAPRHSRDSIARRQANRRPSLDVRCTPGTCRLAAT